MHCKHLRICSKSIPTCNHGYHFKIVFHKFLCIGRYNRKHSFCSMHLQIAVNIHFINVRVIQETLIFHLQHIYDMEMLVQQLGYLCPGYHNFQNRCDHLDVIPYRVIIATVADHMVLNLSVD